MPSEMPMGSVRAADTAPPERFLKKAASRCTGGRIGLAEHRRPEVAAQRAPHALRGDRHLDALGVAAESARSERIDDRVHHGWRRADCPELAHALHAERIRLA